jgi:hypothetical protein
MLEMHVFDNGVLARNNMDLINVVATMFGPVNFSRYIFRNPASILKLDTYDGVKRSDAELSELFFTREDFEFTPEQLEILRVPSNQVILDIRFASYILTYESGIIFINSLRKLRNLAECRVVIIGESDLTQHDQVNGLANRMLQEVDFARMHELTYSSTVIKNRCASLPV